MKRVPLLVVLFAMCLAFSPPASATLYTMTDGNSVVSVDPTSPGGVYGWNVEGADILYQQWFWYRIGSGAEQSIDTLTLSSADLSTDTRTLKLNYLGDGFDINITYTLTGGPVGSATADIAESIRVNASRPLDFHFFQYSDFDLNQNDNSDIVRISPDFRVARQLPSGGPGPVLSETIMTSFPAATHAEAGYYPGTITKLTDGVASTLSDVLNAGPGDVSWAFQWDAALSPTRSLIISKDKILAPVPEPAAIGLLGGVLLVVASKLRKRLA